MRSHHICGWNRVALLGVAVVAVLAASGPAPAEITRVVVTDSGTLGTYEGRQYLWASAAMEGTVAREDGTVGRYRVPVTLMYPDRDGNGFGVVDVVGIVDYGNYTDETAPLGSRKVLYGGHQYLGDYLRREGFTYMSVQWSRTVTAQLGPDYGVIEDGRDGWEIVGDAARFLRDTGKMAGDPAQRPQSLGHVIGLGWSHTSRLLREFVRSGQNRRRDGALVFDGVLGGGGTACLLMHNDSKPQAPPLPAVPRFDRRARCDAPLPDDGKLLYLLTQTEFENAAMDVGQAETRHDTPNYRQYEMAGVTHLPADRMSLRPIGAIRQNPISFRPVAKAMLRNLVDWIVAGTPPPPPLYIAGQAGADGLFRLELDADGNALGGLRLPHMAALMPEGERAGAPLGVYGGIDYDLLDDRYGYADNAGTFDPFPPAEMARRYPTRAGYVDLVRKAAAHLLAGRYILEDDHDNYIRDAEHVWCTTIAAAPAGECRHQEAAR
jgi:hypothetical protein